MKIAFLCPTLDTDYLKCARAFRAAGAEVALFSFIRERYPVAVADLPVTRLGMVEHGKYLSRSFQMLLTVRRIRKFLSGYDCLYAFNWEMALLGLLASSRAASRPVFVLQMLDIRAAMLGSGPVGRFFRFWERRVLNRVDLLCLTSRAYLDHYYRPVQRFAGRPVFILENKLEAGLPGLDSGRETPSPDGEIALRIGYFGLIRCRRSCEVLGETVEKGAGRVSLLLRGISLGGAPDLEEFAARSQRIEYGGEFRAPIDLPEMFGRINLLWVASPYEDESCCRTDWRWKRTNRFYQGCRFRTPMLAWKNTADGEEVQRRGLGLTLDPDSPAQAAKDILNISPADLRRWRSNLAKLPREIYTYTDEHRRIFAMIQEAARLRKV